MSSKDNQLQYVLLKRLALESYVEKHQLYTFEVQSRGCLDLQLLLLYTQFS